MVEPPPDEGRRSPAGVTAEMIETYMPTAEQDAEWQKDRDRFIDLTYSPLLREGDLPVSAAFTRDNK
jgi:hypothetical protein